MPLVTAVGKREISGAELDVGARYFIEPANSGTLDQNRLFHLLLQEYFASGCFSYPAKTFQELKDYVKRDLGGGFSEYLYIDTAGHKRKSAEYPADCAVNEHGEKLVFGKLKSWADYTKKERRMTIDKLIKLMELSGVQSKRFNELLALGGLQ